MRAQDYVRLSHSCKYIGSVPRDRLVVQLGKLRAGEVRRPRYSAQARSFPVTDSMLIKRFGELEDIHQVSLPVVEQRGPLGRGVNLSPSLWRWPRCGHEDARRSVQGARRLFLPGLLAGSLDQALS